MQEEIQPLLSDLLFPSESDEPVEYFCAECPDGAAPLRPENMAPLLSLGPNVPIHEKDPESFWSFVTQERDWYDDFEQQRTESFQKLKMLLEENLTSIQYFEVGEIEVKLFILGRSQDKIEGITTTAVRT